ncbi:unnamed protein product [Staurois parvus]|uniref:Uncharacterized protein n=1 Tax=Staurois parvus TaxID=386267 RepID=A0ABN9A7W8_9NEOB|nr:unnamed protein product [Staurois parvus]
MQTASTNICERMGCSQELSELKKGTVIGFHLCNKSTHEIVSGIITKWKQLGTTATQPSNGRPHKMTERGLAAHAEEQSAQNDESRFSV